MRVIETRVEDGAGWIVLNRPEAMNAVNDALRAAIPAAVDAHEADPAVRVIVIAGNGPRGFCVGADIRESRPPETVAEAHARLAAMRWIAAPAAAAKPVIAAIHGFCLGGGLELALAADIRLCSHDAQFALPETALGLIPGGGGTQRLARLIGPGPALDMILTGERIGADEARRLGLVTRVVPEGGDLRAAAQALAARLAARPPLAMRHAKAAVLGGLGQSLEAGLALERALFAVLLSTEDRAEAARAFAEKRAPKFTGR
ncbi:MAG: enoyl-CoA hydratase/isomerase family protein [Gemmobacter sp.]